MANSKIYSVMVSSTYKELVEERRVVREEMPGFDLLPIAMEDDACLPDHDLIEASLAKVDKADAYVGLIGYRYGQRPVCATRNQDELSLTELEFRHAVARDIPICMFIMHDDYLVPKKVLDEKRDEERLRAFIELAKKDRIYAEFSSVYNLKPKVVKSLVRLREALEKRAATRAGAAAHMGAKPPAAPAAKPVAESNIPMSVPRHFMGRDETLEAIDAAFGAGQDCVAVTALHGLRGVGKTTLAAAYAERRKHVYRATWWIGAQTESTMRADLVALGVRLGWVASDEKEKPALAVVMERLKNDGAGLLLIYDNANDAESLRDYLPRGGAAKALVTSNHHAWRGVAEPLAIEVWPPAVGADFLIARTGRKNERIEAERLSQTLGGLPLANEQAGAYCDALNVGFAKYRERFIAAPVELMDEAEFTPQEHNNRTTTAKSFQLAIEEASKKHRAAELLIVYAALLAPEPIPLFIFTEAREKFGEPLASLSEAELDKAIAALRAFALVDREEIPDEREPEISFDTIRLHRLVREVAARRREGEDLVAARRALLEALAAVYPRDVDDDPKTWPRARRLDALALGLVGDDAEPPQGAEAQVTRLLNSLAGYRHWALAAYTQARPLLEQALVIDQKLYGPEHIETITGLSNLALLLKTQGDFSGARPLFESVLAIMEKVRGPEDVDTTTSLNNLAGLLQDQGDLAAARPLYERALAIREKVLGPEHRHTGLSLHNLAGLLAGQRDFAGARALSERARAIWEKALGPEHPHTNLARQNLAVLLLATGDLAQALSLAEAALAAHEKTLGLDHPWTKESARVTARALDAVGRGGEAAALRATFGV
jgi:tetratricopeptide (TPR) repeat protein